MTEKDFNYIARVEKAIKEKYGLDAIVNPKSGWDREKEEKYLEHLKEFYDTESAIKRPNKEGKTANRVCPVCGEFSFSIKDDVYMNRYECCFKCYIQYVDNREERWLSGWRPK